MPKTGLILGIIGLIMALFVNAVGFSAVIAVTSVGFLMSIFGLKKSKPLAISGAAVCAAAFITGLIINLIK
jgi:hypothetical protein